jgi:hypothetical protein
MSIVYFAEPAIGLQPKYTEHPEGGIVGNALLFYEGMHKDNVGNPHEVPAQRINLFAVNTNRDFNQGKEIPLMVEHSKTLIGTSGAINKLGRMASPVCCRPIEESDLPNANMKELVGKLGAFAQVHVLNRLDEVKNKTIRALSAGIDPVKNKFVEISAVAFPALSGASLLFSANRNATVNFSNHGLTDYNEAKEKIQAWEKPYQELFKKFDIFAGTLQAIDLEKESSELDFNTNQLKRKALEQLTEDLVDHLHISFEETEESQEKNIYNPNPYDVNMIKNHSETNDNNVVNFNQTSNRKKRDNAIMGVLSVSDCRKKRIRRGAN